MKVKFLRLVSILSIALVCFTLSKVEIAKAGTRQCSPGSVDALAVSGCKSFGFPAHTHWYSYIESNRTHSNIDVIGWNNYVDYQICGTTSLTFHSYGGSVDYTSPGHAKQGYTWPQKSCSISPDGVQMGYRHYFEHNGDTETIDWWQWWNL